ncbi:MAG TPA: DNA mismatch repair endonuclease MutL [Cryomorphaceae bacterium]|nr:DNA mismatch repair endonuclease MutL [Cryomorphaceae bacterium]
MSTVIHHLPEEVANQIAAGEVVQRPASIVKELMENSLDAGATELTVLIQDAGRTSIQVIDNGCGMGPEDLPAAFARHATSKLQSADDLFALQTMGFRGEALASISAVSHASIRSRTVHETVATELSCDGSQLGQPKKVAGSIGTTITAKNLFFNVPARRQFLKNDAIEFKHISETFTAIALAHPTLKLQLKHNGKDVWLLDAGNARQRVAQILGKKANERLVPVEEYTDVVKTEGFVLRPEHARKTRGDQYLYVNKRPIRSGYLHRAIVEAFEGLIPTEHHPAYVLFLAVPSDRVDVNVHPAKTEVKFEDERAIYAILRSAVKRALGIHQVAPTLDFETNLQQHVDLDAQPIPAAPSIQVDPTYNPFHATPSTRSKGYTSPSAGATARESFDFFAPPSSPNSSQGAWDFESTAGTDTRPESSGFCVFLAPHFAVSSLKSGLVTVHIPRAQKHILHQELIEALHAKERLTSQTWLFPEAFEVATSAHWSDWVDILPRLGFQWEHSSEGLNMTAGPHFLAASEAMDWLHDLLRAAPEEEEKALETYVLARLDHWSTTAPIPTGGDLQTLVDRLFACENPWTNAQGKPIARILDGATLAAQFA